MHSYIGYDCINKLNKVYYCVYVYLADKGATLINQSFTQ